MTSTGSRAANALILRILGREPRTLREYIEEPAQAESE
jgi:hypothetical protein